MIEMEKASISCVELNADASYAKYEIAPLERGFGTTLGNALRRVLLSSIPGAAATSIHIDGISHEFSAIPGVKEDVAEIILNIKKLSVKMFTDQVKTCRIDVEGPAVVTAGDIIGDEEIELVKKDQHIATVNKGARLTMSINFGKDRGYCTSDKNKNESMVIGDIAVDSIYTPVTKVQYETQDTRVGQSIDFDALTMQIWTDGSIHPDEAMAMAAKILVEHLQMFVGLTDQATPMTFNAPSEEIGDKGLDMSIEEMDLTVRAYNCLKRAGINTVAELVQRNKEDMIKVRNLGKKSLEEVEEKLLAMGLSFQDSEE
ncbi:MAG: DNA-directed RNA polymerase subunit alpha [Eubacteriales bacterium]|nr:DNA-directed RNA polymerase subunit alpha [Eubacteriales bacterium]